MGITAALTALQAATDAVRAAEHATLLPAAIVHRVGARFIEAADAPGRIVWFPLRETSTRAPASGRGGGTTHGTALGMRLVRIGVHIYGASLDATEALLECVMKATHASAVGSYDFDSIEWELDSRLTSGEVVTLELLLNVPVLRALAPRVTVTTTAVDPSEAASGDNALNLGET